jgi:DNA end-binding protein Ku
MTVDFDPADYHDGYREALQQLIEAKVEGHEVIEPAEPAAAAEAPSSLADALRASLEAAKAGSGKAASSKAKPEPQKASTAKATSAKTSKAKKAAEDGADESKTAAQRRARKAS